MDFTVSHLNFGIIVFNIILGAFIPIFMLIFLRLKHGCEARASWIGCAVFILFALILENVVNSVLLAYGVGGIVQRNILIYGLYSGFMAAFFENVGRFLAFKTVLRKYNGNDHNALMYTVGHGGFELFMLLILPMLSYAAYAAAINAGTAQTLFEGITEQQAAVLTDTLSQLSSASPLIFLASPIQRIAALVVQASMSVLVWFAAKRFAKIALLPAALLLHTVINAISVVLTGCNVPLLPATLVMCVLAALCAAAALRVWKQNRENT